jgi:hypothetical protein
MRVSRSAWSEGWSGACEARSFQFTGQAHGEAESPVKQIAACDLNEAMMYMQRRHADFDILRVEFVALIEMLSGSQETVPFCAGGDQ